jgi:hypothetical protein
MPRPVDNPPNPWSSTHVEWLEEPPSATLSIYEEEAKTVLAENDSPDIPFRFSLNVGEGSVVVEEGTTFRRPSKQGTLFDV